MKTISKNGKNFYFGYENLLAAARDWMGSAETLADSSSVGIVISREEN